MEARPSLVLRYGSVVVTRILGETTKKVLIKLSAAATGTGLEPAIRLLMFSHSRRLTVRPEYACASILKPQAESLDAF